MTPSEAGAVLASVEEDTETPLSEPLVSSGVVVGVAEAPEDVDGSDLRPAELQFCDFMIRGPHPENATRCYQLVHPEANYNTAGVAGPALLKEPRIENYLTKLRRRAIEGSNTDLVAELKNWVPVAVKGKRLLEAHIEGTRRLTGTDLAVIREVLDRAIGRAKETVEHDVGSQMSELIKKLARQRPNRYVRPGSSERPRLPAGGTADNGGREGERSE